MADEIAETERLCLRNWDRKDLDEFVAQTNTPAVMRWLGGVWPLDQHVAAFERLQDYQREFGHTFWIVERKADGALLGFCGLKRVNHPGAGQITGDFEVGWRLREDAWGRGYAKEAAIASIDIAFQKFAASRVVALTVPGNEPSQALMKRLGMTRRKDLDFVDPRFDHPGELNPAIVYVVDAVDWPAARDTALRPR
jgi:RimJ/RimL family protein N-acetyltransferase